MKHGKYLSFYTIPEWAKHYMEYYNLKKILKQLYKILKGSHIFPHIWMAIIWSRAAGQLYSVWFWRAWRLDGTYWDERRREPVDFYNSRAVMYLLECSISIADKEILIQQWIYEYKRNVDKIEGFYHSQLANINNRFEELKITIKDQRVVWMLLLSIGPLLCEGCEEASGTWSKGWTRRSHKLDSCLCWHLRANSLVGQLLLNKLHLLQEVNNSVWTTCRIVKKFAKITRGYNTTEQSSQMMNYANEKDFLIHKELETIKKDLIVF